MELELAIRVIEVFLLDHQITPTTGWEPQDVCREYGEHVVYCTEGHATTPIDEAILRQQFQHYLEDRVKLAGSYWFGFYQLEVYQYGRDYYVFASVYR